jgi:hypothetical protein
LCWILESEQGWPRLFVTWHSALFRSEKNIITEKTTPRLLVIFSLNPRLWSLQASCRQDADESEASSDSESGSGSEESSSSSSKTSSRSRWFIEGL